jgi:integrase
LLTDLKIRALRPLGKPYSVFDGGGLYLYVTPTGTRSWRLKYRLASKERRITFGLYPEVTLAKAREERDAIRRALREGRDPAAEREARRLAVVNGHTFEAMARDWYKRKLKKWRPSHAKEIIDSLEQEVFATHGKLHVKDFTPPIVLALIRAIEDRDAVTVARRIRQRMSAVFVHAIACGVGENDPAAIVKGALTSHESRNQPAILDLGELRTMLRTVESRFTYPGTKLALRLLALTVVRPKEVRFAMWSEFEYLDGVAPIWRIPPDRMKTGLEHIVPLSPAAVDVLRAARMISGRGVYVFPNKSDPGKPISEGLLCALLSDAGFKGKHVPHGFRASFSSNMNKRHKGEADVMEAALAHAVPGVRGDYMRETFDERRREIMAEWADLILQGAPDAETLLLGKRRTDPRQRTNNVIELPRAARR